MSYYYTNPLYCPQMYQSFQSNHFQTPRYWALSSCLHGSAKMVFSSRGINFTCHLPSTIGLVHPLRQSRMHQETPRRKVEVAMKLTRLRLYLVLSILPLALRYPKPWLFYPQTCKMMMLMRTSTICKAKQLTQKAQVSHQEKCRRSGPMTYGQ